MQIKIAPIKYTIIYAHDVSVFVDFHYQHNPRFSAFWDRLTCELSASLINLTDSSRFVREVQLPHFVVTELGRRTLTMDVGIDDEQVVVNSVDLS